MGDTPIELANSNDWETAPPPPGFQTEQQERWLEQIGKFQHHFDAPEFDTETREFAATPTRGRRTRLSRTWSREPARLPAGAAHDRHQFAQGPGDLLAGEGTGADRAARRRGPRPDH
ncbi:hypothetical protein [Streptomyces sp. NEAU-W12]|uniref:hypothetical protein n=1 Tax=Streptomyces sp. NEAU-W12 TaxID=2994668 RepID=UPI00224B48D4|nr:hypothetical protein [Streptomyces sp. NEAU-W12]MCX2927980.1 hypothetical protein [Streptomyces sp. NEAU-W12]